MRSILLAETATTASFFPEYFWVMLLAIVLVFSLALFLFYLGWKGIDAATPGKLDEQLVPPQGGTGNVALAIVVGCMFLGLSIVLAATIVGVLCH